MLRSLLTLTLLAAVALFVATPAAIADNIVLNQWYEFGFYSPNPSPIQGGVIPLYSVAVNGPVLPGGFANSVIAPAGVTWTITTAYGGTLTVNDLEASGDQFQMFDNGLPMGPAASPFTAAGQNPGQVSPGGGFTSVPAFGAPYEADINAALGDPLFSSATFALDPGVNVISGTWLGFVGTGDGSFIAESTVPEPSSLLLLGTGLAGLVGAIRRKLMI